jgi:hypothetical protein
MTACPKCFLPREEGAWQCDGCGFQFEQNIEAVRAALNTQARNSRLAVWWTLLVCLGAVGGVAYLASIGYIYISIPLLLAVVGSVGHAFHRRSVMQEHLRTFERRYAQLPKAIVHDRDSTT